MLPGTAILLTADARLVPQLFVVTQSGIAPYGNSSSDVLSGLSARVTTDVGGALQLQASVLLNNADPAVAGTGMRDGGEL